MAGKKPEEQVGKMTLEEKAGLCSGADVWHLKSCERLGIKGVMVSDGPHGLRTQRADGDNLGINGSIEAVCFPAACATAASFDRALLYDLGETLGEECIAEGVSILLGPAMNIKRTPLCGRNFEYFSEDPYLSGELAKDYVKGVQSKGVGVSVKHFAANNQETDRMVVSADVDERAFREIYLSGFETVVKEAKPYTMMCSYNGKGAGRDRRGCRPYFLFQSRRAEGVGNKEIFAEDTAVHPIYPRPSALSCLFGGSERISGHQSQVSFPEFFQ